MAHVEVYVACLQNGAASLVALAASSASACLVPGSAVRSMLAFVVTLHVCTAQSMRGDLCRRFLHSVLAPLGFVFLCSLCLVQLEQSSFHEYVGDDDPTARNAVYVVTLTLLALAALERSAWPLSVGQTDAALVTAAVVLVCLFHPPLRAIDARQPLTQCPNVETWALRACRLVVFVAISQTTALCTAPRQLDAAAAHTVFSRAVFAASWTLICSARRSTGCTLTKRSANLSPVGRLRGQRRAVRVLHAAVRVPALQPHRRLRGARPRGRARPRARVREREGENSGRT